MEPLIHLIYSSAAIHRFDKKQLTDLLRQSREANERAGLTGMLLYSDGDFFQVLEGEAEAVEKLYEKLHAEKRHSKLTLIIKEPIAKRAFGEWSMGFANVSQAELKKVEGLNDFFHDGSCFAQLDAGRAKKLLAAFADGRWRAKIVGSTRPGAFAWGQ
jgi:Sensors of blue-light using FAD